VLVPHAAVSAARGFVALILALGLAACGRVIPDARPAMSVPPPPIAVVSAPPPPATALLSGVRAGPAFAALPVGADKAMLAFASFRESCPQLITRSDASGLTRPEDWRPVCTAAATWSGSAGEFFASQFETAQVGTGAAFATGYYEPEIAGARTHLAGYDVPIYRLPADLVRDWPADTPPDQRTGKPPLGRYDQTGAFVLYYDRGEIEDGALAGKGLEIAWVADPVEFFFLQIQGSGRLRAPDGSVMRIGYAGQNGLPYSGIGSILKAQGLLGDGPGQYQSSMQGIVKYIHEHPDDGRALMRQDASYVFFRELTGADTTTGPIGALNVPVRPRVSLAADPAYVPLGAPVWLTTDRAPTNGLWVAQDTGGAIKGANRFDSFWGAGAEARLIAGGMDARGTALVLLPKGVLVRLTAR
jgi:membrane-bound lytic murein transglycosylase A